MKTAACVLWLLVGFAGVAQAQNQVNYWMGGNRSVINFENGNASFEIRTDDNMFWRTTSSISDSAGNLLFYTNGYRVFNKNFLLIESGDDLNIGDYESWGYDAMTIGDGVTIVPIPGQPNRYHLFHFDLNDVNTVDGPGLWPTSLFRCVVDMTMDNGNGGIPPAEKDLVVFSDTLTMTGMKAAKHGNGRDWWLLIHEYGSNRYYRFLVDGNGVHGPYSQNIGLFINGSMDKDHRR